jgi:predicted permease
MLSLVRDLKLAVRHLLRSPGFAITAVLMLMFGIGATTAIFSIVEGVLLRPLPYPDSTRLVALGDILEGSTWEKPAVTAPEVRDYMRDTHSFTHLGAYQQTDFDLSGVTSPVVVHAARMSGDLFAALGVSPLMGRVFTQREDEENQHLVVLSYGLWRNRFHGDRNILWTKILLDRKPYVVIGVMPRDFEFPLMPGHLNQSVLWVPLSLTSGEATTGASTWNFEMVGRLKSGTAPGEALSDAERVAQNTMRAFPSYMHNLRIRPRLEPLEEATVEQARPLIRVLFLAVTVVFLIVCANLAGFLLVRAMRRRREIAVRLALGAAATTLLRQALLESLVLSVTGGVLGLSLAALTVRAGVSLLPETLPRISDIGLD